MSKLYPFYILIALMLVACGTQEPAGTGLQIVSEVTLGPPTAALPTRILSPTPVRLTPEIVPPLENVTVEADYVLVTPTLPPSKTPTVTATQTMTPTLTLTPTPTVTANATTFLLPTSIVIPVTQIAAAPADEVCDSTWFFIQPRPPGCPQNPPNVSQGVFQRFENGYMVWVGSQDAIYVLYNDAAFPRWRAYRDFFVEGMPEVSGAYLNAPRPGLWQPRRGFGLLWRDDASLRNRLGWAAQEWEQPYSVRVQTGSNGTIFVSQPGSAVFGLITGGSAWQEYSGGSNSIPLPAAPAQPGGAPVSPGGVPLPTIKPPGL